ncbi:hypothetical protein A3Q56_05683 [Intoshia linei]|uniref:Uncharacterized protein n=1 Tax=Intoshia linei TaxID=1819745 RepID=A0A177AX42_9BILA|nr:hypothetical protein A3Q56_05683 [Intoshia linei]
MIDMIVEVSFLNQKCKVPMFDKFIDKLKVNGYVSEESMFAIEYDFRVPSEDYIKTQLENIFKKSKKKKMIVTHSYGGIMTLLALSKMNNELVRDNVKSVVLISCPLGGATESLFAYLTGQFHSKFDLNFILSILLKHTLRLCTTMYLLMSNIKSPNYSKTLLTKFGKNYTMHNLEWIIGSRRYNEYKKYQKKMQELFTYLTKFLESSGKNSPFTLYCVYGITTTPHTVLSYNYDKGTVDVTTGDGSVEESSLELCTKYTKTENRKKITLDDKIDQHVFILRYEEVEWSDYIKNFSVSLSENLKQNGKELKFGRLSSEEKYSLIDSQIAVLSKSDFHKQLTDRLHLQILNSINESVENVMRSEYTLNTKPELILTEIIEASSAILTRWPHLTARLGVFINQPLTNGFRKVIWKILLDNTTLRKKLKCYFTETKRDLNTVEPKIQSYCKWILDSKFYPDLANSSLIHKTMCSILQYFKLNELKPGKENTILKSHYLFLLPFIQNMYDNYGQSEFTSPNMLVRITELYLSFISTKPELFGNEKAKAESEFCNQILDHLHKNNPETIKNIVKNFNLKIDGEENEQNQLLLDTICFIILPVLSCYFVGYCQSHVTMFLWDQYIIGFNSKNYTDQLLVYVSAIYISLVVPNIEKIDEGRGLTNELTKISLPSGMNIKPWILWDIGTLPYLENLKSRRLDNERIRKKFIEKQRRDQETIHKIELKKKDDVPKQVIASLPIRSSDTDMMEKKLENEKIERLRDQFRSKQIIQQLRREIDELKRYKTFNIRSRSPSVQSFKSEIASLFVPPVPAPSLATNSLIGDPEAEKPHIVKEKIVIKEIITSFLKKANIAVNQLCHGESRVKDDLNEESIQAIIEHQEDVKEAEIEVFGAPIDKDTFKNIKKTEKERLSLLLIKKIREKTELRRFNELHQK